jgi:hypothetical protein
LNNIQTYKQFSRTDRRRSITANQPACASFWSCSSDFRSGNVIPLGCTLAHMCLLRSSARSMERWELTKIKGVLMSSATCLRSAMLLDHKA